jgi:hypothetical protein
MPNSPIEIVGQYMVASNLCYFAGETPVTGKLPLWLSQLPVSDGNDPLMPNDAMGLFGTTGTLDGRYMATGFVVDHPGFQIRIRHHSYTAGWDLAHGIFNDLTQNVRNTAVAMSGGTEYIRAIKPTTNVIDLGVGGPGGGVGRVSQQFTINFRGTFADSV